MRYFVLKLQIPVRIELPLLTSQHGFNISNYCKPSLYYVILFFSSAGIALIPKHISSHLLSSPRPEQELFQKIFLFD